MFVIVYLFTCVAPVLTIGVDSILYNVASKFSRYYFKDVEPIKVGDIQSIKLCFHLEDTFELFRVSLLDNWPSVIKEIDLDKLVFKSDANEAVIEIKKLNIGWIYVSYQFNVFINNKKENKHSGDLSMWRLERKMSFLQITGHWKGSTEFKPINQSHSTNCPHNKEDTTWELPSNTFIHCSDTGVSSIKNQKLPLICSFEISYLLSLTKKITVEVCYKPEQSFHNISLIIVNSDVIRHIVVLDQFNRNDWNEVELEITPAENAENFQIIFDGQKSTSQSRINFQKGEKLALVFYGEWEGSRHFNSENIQNFTNCTQNESQTSAIYITGALLLTIGAVVFVITFMIYRKARSSKEASRTSDTNHGHLDEDAEPAADSANVNVHQAFDDDAQCYVNFPFQEETIDNPEGLTYLELDFDATNNKRGKSKKCAKKKRENCNKSNNRGQPKGSEEITHASIVEPEVFLEKESVAYANVGDYWR